MKKYRTANGKLVDMDGLRLANEDTIAVGNMRTNARGDELGPGGKVVKTRNEKMNENYKLHTMVPKDDAVHADTLSADLASGKRFDALEEVRETVKRRETRKAEAYAPVEPPKVIVEEKPRAEEPVPEHTPAQGLDFGTINDLSKETPVVTRRQRGSLAAEVTKTKPLSQNETSIPTKSIKRI